MNYFLNGLLIIYVAISLCSIELVSCHKKNNQPKNDDGESLAVDEKAASKNNPSVTFAKIKNSFQMSKREEKTFSETFNVKNIELIAPRNQSSFDKCLLGTTLNGKNGAKAESVFVTLEKPQEVRAWYSLNTKATVCSAAMRKSQRKGNDKLQPVEFVVAKAMKGKSRFSRFYLEYSAIRKGSNASSYNMYVYQRYMHGTNLRTWFRTKAKSMKPREIENNLKIFFKQIHNALTMLLESNFLYTDLKPENIVINTNNQKGSSFLVNLDNVVSLVGPNKQFKQICKDSLEFIPPTNDRAKLDAKALKNQPLSHPKLVASFLKLEKENATNRWLSWTFCLSVFSLVCDDFGAKIDEFRSRSLYKNWRNENAPLPRYFKCKNRNDYSPELFDFLDSCLFKSSKPAKEAKEKSVKTPAAKRIENFAGLIEHEWFGAEPGARDDNDN